MGDVARKQRAFRDRETLILEAGRTLLLKRGYHGLTMDRVAEAVEYSKATVYQHFHCKEEIISALAKRYLEDQFSMMLPAAVFRGTTRERMTALGQAVDLFTRLYTDEVHILHIIQTQAISEKASEEVQSAMRDIEFRSMALLTNVTREAIGLGELSLPPQMPPEELSVSLWCSVIGAQEAMIRGLHLNHVGIRDPLATIFDMCQAVGDGYGWKPLSTQWDYAATRRRVCETIFPDESRRVGKGQSRGLIPIPA